MCSVNFIALFVLFYCVIILRIQNPSTYVYTEEKKLLNGPELFLLQLYYCFIFFIFFYLYNKMCNHLIVDCLEINIKYFIGCK